MKGGMKFDMSSLIAGCKRRGIKQQLRKEKTARDVADFVEGKAVDNAPIDKGTLSHDIKGVVQDGPNGTAAVIHVPLNAPSSQYSTSMHEDEYNLGENSQRKQERLGNTVGRKFITRAIDENEADIREIIKEGLKHP